MLPQSVVFAFLLSSTVSALPGMVERRYPAVIIPNPAPHRVRGSTDSSSPVPQAVVPVVARAEVTPQPSMAERRYLAAIVPNPAPHRVQKRAESITPGAPGVARSEATPQPRMAERRYPAVIVPNPASNPVTPVVARAEATPLPGSNPKLVPDETWAISNATRYCAADNSGCDYNFDITIGCDTEHCTIIRKPGSNAATESWSNVPCSTDSDVTISWGYITEPAPAYAVITVNKGTELAWFGISNVNGGKVTSSSPFGSGEFGDLPSSPVYEYN